MSDPACRTHACGAPIAHNGPDVLDDGMRMGSERAEGRAGGGEYPPPALSRMSTRVFIPREESRDDVWCDLGFGTWRSTYRDGARARWAPVALARPTSMDDGREYGWGTSGRVKDPPLRNVLGCRRGFRTAAPTDHSARPTPRARVYNPTRCGTTRGRVSPGTVGGSPRRARTGQQGRSA